MTAEERAMIRAILLDPWDDALRLIYADWLEEHGQEGHARFVREGACDARIQHYRSEHGVVVTYMDLPEDVEVVLPGWYGDSGVTLSVYKGMVAGWSGSAGEFVMIAGRLFAEQPIADVSLTDKGPWRYGDWYHWHHYEYPATCPPSAIARYLKNGPYPSRLEAHTALSAACVAWGRDVAGLPPLPARPT